MGPHVWTLLTLFWSFDIVFLFNQRLSTYCTVFYLKMIHCYEFYASPVISRPRYFELFFHFPLGLRNSEVRLLSLSLLQNPPTSTSLNITRSLTWRTDHKLVMSVMKYMKQCLRNCPMIERMMKKKIACNCFVFTFQTMRWYSRELFLYSNVILHLYACASMCLCMHNLCEDKRQIS